MTVYTCGHIIYIDSVRALWRLGRSLRGQRHPLPSVCVFSTSGPRCIRKYSSRTSKTSRDDKPMSIPRCTLYSAASRKYLPGLAVLASSFRRLSMLDGCTMQLFWHENVSDSILSEDDLRLLRCSWNGSSLSLRRADDARMALYLAYAAANAASPSSLLKLELLLEDYEVLLSEQEETDGNAVFVQAAGQTRLPDHLRLWMDADFLVLGDLLHVQRDVTGVFTARSIGSSSGSGGGGERGGRGMRPSRSSPSWWLHGSGERSSAPSSLNAGFLALQGAVPAEVRRSVNEVLSMRRRLPRSSPGCRIIRIHRTRPSDGPTERIQCGDQALLRYSVGRKIRIHRDWHVNYRPDADANASALRAFRAVHWSGASKPWGEKGPFRSDQPVPFAMDAAWQGELRVLRTRCPTVPAEINLLLRSSWPLPSPPLSASPPSATRQLGDACRLPRMPLATLRHHRRSSIGLIAGTGPSSGALTASQAELLQAATDVWALNQFVAHRHLIPRFYHLELSAIRVNHANMSAVNLAADRDAQRVFLDTKVSSAELFRRFFDVRQRERYANHTLFVVPRTRDPALGPSAAAHLLQSIGPPCPRGLAAYELTHDPVTSSGGGCTVAALRRAMLPAPDPFFARPVAEFCHASLTRVLDLMLSLEYEHIALIGVDLTSPEHFYSPGSALFAAFWRRRDEQQLMQQVGPALQRHEAYERSVVAQHIRAHGSAIHPTAARGVHHFIAAFAHAHAGRVGLASLSPSSLLLSLSARVRNASAAELEAQCGDSGGDDHHAKQACVMRTLGSAPLPTADNMPPATVGPRRLREESWKGGRGERGKGVVEREQESEYTGDQEGEQEEEEPMAASANRPFTSLTVMLHTTQRLRPTTAFNVTIGWHASRHNISRAVARWQECCARSASNLPEVFKWAWLAEKLRHTPTNSGTAMGTGSPPLPSNLRLASPGPAAQTTGGWPAIAHTLVTPPDALAVLLADADTLFQCSSSEILERFASFEARVVLSAEKNQWPAVERPSPPPTSVHRRTHARGRHHNDTSPQWRPAGNPFVSATGLERLNGSNSRAHLSELTRPNGGLLMGSRRGMLAVWRTMRRFRTFPCCPAVGFGSDAHFVLPPCRKCRGQPVKRPSCAVSSQACLQATLLKATLGKTMLHRHHAVIDVNATLFLSTYGVERGELDLDSRGRIRYVPSGRSPCVIHFNGAAKIVDYRLGARSRATWVPHKRLRYYSKAE